MFSDQLKLATLVRGIGAPNSAYFNFLYGHNHIGTADLVGKNQDHQGYVFFTKTNFYAYYTNLREIATSNKSLYR